jgi:hypothetical protein
MLMIDHPPAVATEENGSVSSGAAQTLRFRYQRALIAAAPSQGNALEGRNCYWRRRVEKRGFAQLVLTTVRQNVADAAVDE